MINNFHTKRYLADLFISVAIITAGFAMITWGGERAIWTMPMLAVVAFNLGRWRGYQEADAEVPDTPNTLLAR